MIAAIAAEMKDVPRQIQALDDLLKVDSADIESARQLATLLAPLKDDRRSEEAYRRVVGIDPFDRDAQAAYGRLAMKRKDGETAQRAFRAALARNPPDRATAHVDLAEAYAASGRVGRGEEGDSGSARDRAVIRARAGSAVEGRADLERLSRR